jgi:hypothetical protein
MDSFTEKRHDKRYTRVSSGFIKEIDLFKASGAQSEIEKELKGDDETDLWKKIIEQRS